jgi:hypothetical protein
VFGCSVGAYLDKGSDNLYHPEKVELRSIFLPTHPLLIICNPSEEARSKQRANKAERIKPFHRRKIITEKESAVSRARQGGLLKLLGGAPLSAVLASEKLGEKRSSGEPPPYEKARPLTRLPDAQGKKNNSYAIIFYYLVFF